jgi:hypothetical protein
MRICGGTTGRSGCWTLESVYELFPRLRERDGHGGNALSGGEQQMLANRPGPHDESRADPDGRAHGRASRRCWCAR